MKVALILSPFNQLKAAGFTTDKVKKIYGYSMPLGIAYLAASLEKNGHDVSVLDPCPLQMSKDEIVSWTKKQNPDVVGISAMTHVVKNAYELVNSLKKDIPGLPVIMGGSHCTVFPESSIVDCPSIDVVVIGEAEERIVQLVEAVHKKEGLEKIKGIIYRDKESGEVINTGPPYVQKNLNGLPFPARHLFDNDLYTPFPDQIRKTPVTNFMASRGCTWRKCKFCFESGKHMPVYRLRSPENVVEELKEVKKIGFNGVAFWDDNFCISEYWVGKVCDLIKKEKLDLTWTCYGRANTITQKIVDDLKSAGCFSIYIGFESGNQEILDLVNKGTTLEETRKAVKLCHKAGIEVRGSFILGFPWDTPELAKESIKFAKELDLDFVKFMLYTPEQGTELYDIAMENGVKIDRGFQGSLTKATYLPKAYDCAEQLEKIARKANMSYVLRPKFLLRKIRSIRSYQDFRKYFDGFLMMISLRRK